MLLSEQTMGLVSAILRRPSEGDFFACCSLSVVAKISADEDDKLITLLCPSYQHVKEATIFSSK